MCSLNRAKFVMVVRLLLCKRNETLVTVLLEKMNQLWVLTVTVTVRVRVLTKTV